MRTILKTRKPFWGALKQYSKCYNVICHFKLYSLHVCQIVIFPYFISVQMKYQVVISTGVIFETIFITALQAIPSQLSSISLTTSLHQVRIILVFLGKVNAEGKILA